MKQRFTAADYRYLAICLFLLAGATWFSVRNFHRAFPEASIDFRVSRAEGQTIAGKFLNGQGYATAGYTDASSFTYDDETKTFLERELGLEKANTLMGTRVRLWRWSYRWFRPLQKEEFRADVTPDGSVAGFDHEIAEDAARPAIDAAQARAAAEDFLRSRMHRDPAALDFVEVSEVERPHRTDRTYTWKERDFNLRDATYRIAVTLHGSEIAGYGEYLKIPEQWSRDYQRLRSKNEAASMVDAALLVALMVGLIAVIALRVRRQDIRWRRAAVVGGIGMVLAFLSHLNSMPTELFRYPTTDSYGSFLARQLLNGVIAAFGAGGLLFVLTAGAETVYREMFPGRVSLANLFRAGGLRTKSFFLGAVLGIALCALFIAYQTAFYIVAYRYGAWSPADVPYDDLLNTKFPWLFVMFGGFLPAVSEEFLFRMFGIPFLRKLARSTAIAVVVAGFVWGFGHAAYPQQPFYIRGVEVGIGGVVLGLIMLRWGILPTLVWHYSVDAMYSAMLLLRSHSLYFRLSGAASAGIIVLPVLVALIAYWRKGGFEPETGLLNGDEAPPTALPEPAAAAERAPEPKWQSMPARTRIAAVAVCAAGIAALAIPTQRFGVAPVFRISPDQARAASDAFLRAQGLKPEAFRNVTVPDVHWGDNDANDGLAGKYFLERLPIPAVSRLFERYRPLRYWKTRYFKSLDREELLVTVHPETGKILGYQHTLPEDRPGADIGDDAARATAAAFAASMGWDVAAMDLKENTSEKKKARRDHELVWEARAGDPRNAGEVRYRVAIGVAGDHPAGAAAYWKVPENYIRARQRQNFISISIIALRFGSIAALVVFGLWMLVRSLRAGLVRWRLVLAIAIPAGLLMPLQALLSMHTMLANYPTAVPLETFQAITYLVVAMSTLIGFVIAAASIALLASYFPDAIASLRAGSRRALAGGAVLAFLAAVGLALLARQIELLLTARFPAQASFELVVPGLLVSTSPALSALAGLQGIFAGGAGVAVCALLWRRFRQPWIRLVLGFLAAFAVLPLDIRTAGEFALQYGLALLEVAVPAVFCLVFARGNYLAYALVLAAMAERSPLAELFGNPMPGLAVNGWIVAAILAALFLWALAPLGAVRERAVPAAGAE
ncbi:MAG TPA: type II CAAX endopeptidase family protein [Bryobacteraceae bacterium]|nr:type II CAAX endopeptidase family protein [Bryobacteraceae bacterium]